MGAAMNDGDDLSCYGQALFDLRCVIPLERKEERMEEEIGKNVKEALVSILLVNNNVLQYCLLIKVEMFSDTLEISLCYEPDSEKLTLGVIQAEIKDGKHLGKEGFNSIKEKYLNNYEINSCVVRQGDVIRRQASD